MNAQIEMRLITSKYRRYKFIHTASCTAHTDRSPTYYFSGAAVGRKRKFKTFKMMISEWRLSARSGSRKIRARDHRQVPCDRAGINP
jgi:hypothetical protein